MRYLLDINVLIALLDPDHTFHERVHDWWRRQRPAWASCPLTENGVLRIMSSMSYSRVQPFTVAELARALQVFVSSTDHEFWHDSISVLDGERFLHARILSSRHLTDLYLLALAVERRGCLATFDRGIPAGAIPAALSLHLEVV
jgi:hypothetical protein